MRGALAFPLPCPAPKHVVAAASPLTVARELRVDAREAQLLELVGREAARRRRRCCRVAVAVAVAVHAAPRLGAPRASCPSGRRRGCRGRGCAAAFTAVAIPTSRRRRRSFSRR